MQSATDTINEFQRWGYHARGRRRRLKENREKFADETLFDVKPEEKALMGLEAKEPEEVGSGSDEKAAVAGPVRKPTPPAAKSPAKRPTAKRRRRVRRGR